MPNRRARNKALKHRVGAAERAIARGKEAMIVHSRRFLILETPARLLGSWITPVESFFVRNHLPQPRVNLAEWRLVVTGEVARPLVLTFADLEKLERSEVTNTIECAGNGRTFHRPRVSGTPWGRGAVGNAVFSGPSLATLLRLASVKATGKHVAFRGLDRPTGKVPDFIRSIPIEKAMHPDTLLAIEMNGAQLTIEHGFPVRALVPGWLGAASVKWLREIRVAEREYEGYFMSHDYRFPTSPDGPGAITGSEDTAAITALPVKSIITEPGDRTRRRRGPIRIAGAAWVGEAEVVRVDISTDGGHMWLPATLGEDRAKYAWRLWEYVWKPRAAGSYVVMSRATDSAGRTQPTKPVWNAPGYLLNSIDRIRIQVRD
jgi:sulfite oxidase